MDKVSYTRKYVAYMQGSLTPLGGGIVIMNSK